MGFATGQWREQHGLEGGERNADAEIVEEATRASAPTSWAATCSAAGTATWDEGVARLVGRGPALPRAGVRAHPPPARAAGDGGRHDVHFVTDGIEAALEQARAAAGDRDVSIAGGASAVRQYLAAGLLDELLLHLVPITLGAGERLLDDIGGLTFEPIDVVASPGVTHLSYRVA